MSNPPKIVIDHVSKQFVDQQGQQALALEDISLTIDTNEFVSIVGRSGGGKTTLLNMIAGLLRPSAGAILIDGRAVAVPGPDRGRALQ